MLLAAVVYAQRGAGPGGAGPGGGAPGGGGQGGRGGAGRGGPPANVEPGQAWIGGAAQTELDAKTPQIPFDATALELMPAGHTIGETEGVALNSKKHIFVYTRSGNSGPARGATAAELFEFDQTGKYIKE